MHEPHGPGLAAGRKAAAVTHVVELLVRKHPFRQVRQCFAEIEVPRP
jgi:hypothetical protein